MSDTPTPRTDAFYSGPCKHVTTRRQQEFARELERELAEAREQIAKLNSALDNASAIYDAAKEQRDRLAEACRWAQTQLGKHTRPSPLDNALAGIASESDDAKNRAVFFESALHEQGDILAKTIQQRDALAEALRSIDPGPDYEITDDMHDGGAFCELSVRDIRAIRAALQNVPTNQPQ